MALDHNRHRRRTIRIGAFATICGLTTFALSATDAGATGRPSGTKAAPYLPTTTAGATSTSLVVAPGRVVIDGKGFGHGVGLAQDGAFWMGKAGKSVGQILSHFFPGTTLAKRGGPVRVPLASVGALTFTLPSGGSAGGVAVPVGGAVRAVAGTGVVSVNLVGASPPSSSPLTSVMAPTSAAVTASGRSEPSDDERSGGFSGRFGVPIGEPIPSEPARGEPTIPPASPTATLSPATPSSLVAGSGVGGSGGTTIPVSTVPSASEDSDPVDTIQTRPGAVSATQPVIRVTAAKGGVIVVGTKKYRGTIELAAKSQGMTVVNELDVEQYLRGMAEVTDPRWPAAALQAQAVVARTYALRMMGSRGSVCPTQACQVYVGAQAEYPEMDAAIAATAGKVVVYKGELANTFYSASGGGTIADPSEVFGEGTPIPYLKAGTYPTGDPKAWRVELSLVELGRRVGYPGTLYDVAVSKVGPSGRAVEVTFIGSGGARSIPGPKFDRILGLRSTNFQLIVGRSDSGATTTAYSGPVIELDVGVLADTPVDFQSGLFDDPTALGDGSASSTLMTTVPVSATQTAPLSSSRSSSPPSTEVPRTSAAVRGSASTVRSAEPKIDERALAESGVSGGAPASDPSDARRVLSLLALGLCALGGIGWAMRWALRTETPRRP